MPRVRHDDELGLRPGPVEGPGALQRADDVVTPLDDDGRDVADAVDVLEELAFAQEALVDEIMALDPGKGVGEGILAEFL